MCVSEARQARYHLVDLGVVLHRARPERIKAKVDVIVPGRKAGEMPDHVHLAELGHAFYAGAEEGLIDDVRYGSRRRVERRKVVGVPSGGTELEEELLIQADVRACPAHCNASTSASISSRRVVSVTHTRTLFAISG